MNLALFDLDHTLLPLDSDYEWNQFLTHIGAVDEVTFAERNDYFFQQYLAGTLDPIAYLEFALGQLAQHPRSQLDIWHAQFMEEIIKPALHPAAHALLAQHREAGDLIAIITATNRFVTEPIAAALKVDHLIAALPEERANGTLTGKLIGGHTYGMGKVLHTHHWLAEMGHSLEDFKQSYFYSDSHNDIPLLSLVTHPIATNPNSTLATHAKTHGWRVLELFAIT